MVEGSSKERPKAKLMESGELIVKRKTHLSVVLGITFCVIGGAVVASSFILDWVLPGSDNISMWDLLQRGGVYLLVPLVPMTGGLVAIISSLDILAEKGRKRFKSIASIGALACSLLLVISLVIVALQIEADYVAAGDASFGPALFMSVFGGVLALSGGMILTIDYLEARRRRGRFTASGGSAQLKSALKPTTGKKKAKPQTMDKEFRDEVLAAKEARDTELNRPAPSGLECPTCYSPVQPNWQICPICGQELL
ncbi:MAG: zinc ribbon domain-containing protein [Methanomassiliicoccales archaeon]|nr:zinc ribbon domain-containing protein [Methanomassiliicoccales archaeon]